MESWILTIWLFIIFGFSYTFGYSFHDNPQRACGDRLANMLSLVCKDRGYYDFFPPEDKYRTGGRYKRGIVEECCHSVCSYYVLQQYCNPVTTETPDNSQIRKRSDNDKNYEPPSLTKTDDTTTPLFRNFYNRYDYINQKNDDGNLHESVTENPKEIQDKAQSSTISLLNSGTNLFRNLLYPDNSDKEVASDKKNDDDKNKITEKTNGIENLNKPIKSVLVFKIRNSVESNMQNDDNAENEKQNRDDALEHVQRQEHNRSVFSKVGIVNPYFLEREVIHPYVRPSINFTVNLRQQVSNKR